MTELTSVRGNLPGTRHSMMGGARAADAGDGSLGLDATTGLRTDPSTGGRAFPPGLWFGAELLVVSCVALLAALVVQAPAWLACGVLAAVLVVNHYDGGQRTRPGLPHLGQVVRDMALPFAFVVLGSAVGVLPAADPRDAAFVIGLATAGVLGMTMLRRRVSGTVRVLVVGDRMAIGAAATRWAGDTRVRVVGALLHEPDVSTPYVFTDSFGVHTITGIDEVSRWAGLWQADMVVVSPGPGMTSEEVRRLSWLLEGSNVSLAVMGVLDSVAPHRIDSTSLAGVTFVHVRSSRQSGFVRAVKAGLDRTLALLILVVAGPLIAALVVAIRVDSRGPGLFRQVRVGRDGREFVIYKLRTMTTDAEQRLAQLAALDEGAGHLFKIKHDPRITRLGRLLRKTSLDELPQLFNVVKGEMSLVGPRPALPAEVARYSETERRRLAVQPGITGLWQVSGRSDLSWAQSVELDLRYTDNWRLTDDVLILARTVGAVTRSEGAY